MRAGHVLLAASLCLLPRVAREARGAERPVELTNLYGALQDDPARWAQERAAGLNVVVLEPVWSRYEPRPDAFDTGYVNQLRKRLADARAAGFRVVLSPGWQYPPAWIFTLPHSRYVNQYGDVFADPAPGMAGFNAVFNPAMRARQEKYLRRLFADLGQDFLAVRLGGGWYNELNYPPPHFHGHVNCYWAFDDLAQGRAPVLPPGMGSCPDPGWVPGTPASGSGDLRASRFLNWYLDALKNYHDWQITVARTCYAGPLAMLYPSWGIRPGQIDAAIADQLAGKTTAEVNGEVPRGFDFARVIHGITDPKVIVYCTWVDAHTGNDLDPNPAHWEPVHYLATLARENPLHLTVWGENTGGNTAAEMQFSFEQMRRYHLAGLMWAFDRQLYDDRHATLKQFSDQIGSARPAPDN